ncbi:MAG: hypothetical protein M3O02_09430 [Acidobacteriota bacterium]|nr:hypothetical protein [Acidobacteriota bacterium]
MKNGVKAAIGVTAFAVLCIGGELLYLHHERNAPAANTLQTAAPQRADPDDLVFLKNKRPSSLADLKELYGSTVWISAGGQMEYYPAAGHRADYAHSAGTLLGAEPLVIKDAFEQVAPKTATYRVPGGDRQVLLTFTLPRSADPQRVYAFPVGYRQGADFTFFTDELFFYEDPHVLYKHWGPQIWQAVDSHQVILGMNERQVQLALGQVSKSLSNEYGNRLVIYANTGHPMAVTFAKNKVTAFRPDQGY